MGPFEQMVENQVAGRSSLTENVANTILKQIKAVDHWALARWAARNKISTTDGWTLPTSIGRAVSPGEGPQVRIGSRGGLQMDVRGGNLKQGGRVYIGLNNRDLYDVVAGRLRKKDYSLLWITTDISEDVPVENLVDVLDRMIG